MHKNSKYIGITIGILILIVLSSGCISNSDSNNTQPVKTYAANGISFNYPGSWHVYADNGSGVNMILASPENSSSIISFAPQFQVQITPNSYFSDYTDIPDNDTVSTNDSNDFLNEYNGMPYGIVLNNDTMPNASLNSNSTSKNNFLSEQEIISIMRNSANELGTKISNDTLTIDNKTAYVDTFIVNSLIPPMIDKRFEQIIFVKNNKTYLILLQAQDWDFDKEKQNFDIILNSFKVQ